MSNLAENGRGKKRTAYSSSESGPHPIDKHVGERLKLLRNKLSITQSQLADALKLTFQQVQKYERGSNRISASRLYQMSQLLSTNVSFFFDDMPKDGYDIPSTEKLALSDNTIADHDSYNNPSESNEALKLITLFNKIPEQSREQVLGIMEGLARSTPPKKTSTGDYTSS